MENVLGRSALARWVLRLDFAGPQKQAGCRIREFVANVFKHCQIEAVQSGFDMAQVYHQFNVRMRRAES
jgi:hypothetical protein